MTEGRSTMWLGLLAVLFSVLAWGVIAIITVIFAYTEFKTPGGLDALGDDSPVIILVGALFILALPLNLIGLLLAVGGILSRTEKKLFAIIGGLMSFGLFVLMAVVLALGFAEGST